MSNSLITGCKSYNTSSINTDSLIKIVFKQFKNGYSILRCGHIFKIMITCFCIMVCIVTNAQKTTTTKTVDSADDNTYGSGGRKVTKIYITKDNLGETISTVTEIYIYYPTLENCREFNTTVVNGDGSKTEHITYRDATGDDIAETKISYDLLGIETYRFERKFKDRKQISGFERGIDKNGKKYLKTFNRKTEDYDEKKDVSNSPLPENNQVSTEQPINTTNISFHSNEAFIGPAYLNIANAGQGNSGYGSFGFTGEYTRFITPHFGATMDVGVYFKKETQNDFTQSFTQFNVTAGATYIPCKDPWKEDKKFTGDLHVLLGLSSIMVKESSGSYGLDNISKQCFTFALGAAGDYHISPRIKIRLQADYMHTSFFNTMQNNFRISAGPTIGF